MGVEVDIELPTLKELKLAFRNLPRNIAAKHMTAALGRAINVPYKRLKKNTPRGPTGNLKKAVKKKTKKYVRDGAGVALVGYAKPPRGTAVEDRKDNELGYHAHLLEKGTKARQTEGRLASSFKSTKHLIHDSSVVAVGLILDCCKRNDILAASIGNDLLFM